MTRDPLDYGYEQSQYQPPPATQEPINFTRTQAGQTGTAPAAGYQGSGNFPMLVPPGMGGPAPMSGPQLLPDGGLGEFHHGEDHALLDAAAAYAAVEAMDLRRRWRRYSRSVGPGNTSVPGFRFWEAQRHQALMASPRRNVWLGLLLLLLTPLFLVIAAHHQAEFAFLAIGTFLLGAFFIRHRPPTP
jgi:hypothetical protein